MFEAYESGEGLRFVRRMRAPAVAYGAADLVAEDERAEVTIRRAEESELPAEIGLGFADSLADFRASAVSSRRLVGGSRRVETSETGAAMRHAAATAFADAMLQDIWAGRETYGFALPRRTLALEPADIVAVTSGGVTRTVLVTRIEDAAARRIEARSVEPDILAPLPADDRAVASEPEPDPSAPEIVLLDLPLLGGSEAPYAPRIAAFSEPWPGTIAVSIGTAESGFVARQSLERSATIGDLTAVLLPGPTWRWDRANAIEVDLHGGSLASLPELAVLNGGNAAAIGSPETGWEVVQFATATLTGATTWRLSGLLRGQGGTGDIAALGHAAGARFVLLDGAVESLALSEAELGLALTLRCGAAGVIYDPEIFVDVPVTAGRRGLRCLAPVRIAAIRDPGSDDVTIGWTRQTRIGGDAWEPVDVPLGEAAEAYRVEILDGMAVVRSVDVNARALTYAAVDQVADFGALPEAISLRVAQISATEGAGTVAMTTVQF